MFDIKNALEAELRKIKLDIQIAYQNIEETKKIIEERYQFQNRIERLLDNIEKTDCGVKG